jgi:hypothetical protein
MWNPISGDYDWAIHANGLRETTDWGVFYPDAQEQVWPVAFGLTTGSRAKSLVSKFDRAQPRLGPTDGHGEL